MNRFSRWRGGFKNFWRAFRHNRLGLLGLIMLAAAIVIAVFAPLIAPTDPYARVRVKVEDIYAPPSAAHPFGTDDAGKDVLSAFIALLELAKRGTLSLAQPEPFAPMVIRRESPREAA